MKLSFEQRSEDFTPSPFDIAVGHVVTCGMLAGLLDAVSVFVELLGLLEGLDR